MKKVIGAIAIAILTASTASAGPQLFKIDAEETHRRENRIEAFGVSIRTASSDVVTADYATYSDKDANRYPPRVVELLGTISIQINNLSINADSARYYPELNTYTSARFHLPSTFDKIGPSVGCSSSGNQVQLTFANGTVITGDSMCSGGTLYTCSNHQLNKAAGMC